MLNLKSGLLITSLCMEIFKQNLVCNLVWTCTRDLRHFGPDFSFFRK